MKRETRQQTTALSREIKELTKTINELVRKRNELRHTHRRLLDSDKEHMIKVLSKRLIEHKTVILGHTGANGIPDHHSWRLNEIKVLEDKIAAFKADIAIEEALR